MAAMEREFEEAAIKKKPPSEEKRELESIRTEIVELEKKVSDVTQRSAVLESAGTKSSDGGDRKSALLEKSAFEEFEEKKPAEGGEKAKEPGGGAKIKYIDKEDEKLFKELEYYHGYLAREDVQVILRQEGDYMLRLSEVDGDPLGRQLVLSVLTAPSASRLAHHAAAPPKVRHLVVGRQQTGEFRIDETASFGRIADLVAHYQKTSYLAKTGVILLRNPVKLQSWEFSHENVKLLGLLGEGAFGEVREGILMRKKKGQVRVAVKLGKGQSEQSKAKVKEMMREARIQGSLRHKNVVRLFGILALEQPIGIVLELVEDGSLDAYLRMADGMVDIREKLFICRDAANGLAYIHANQVIHRDIAARNCLYSGKSKVVKISDFGLSKKMWDPQRPEYKMRSGGKLPIKWLAPETLRERIFSKAADVYSFGILLYEIFANGAEPWKGVKNPEVKKKMLAGEFLELPADCPPKVKELVRTGIFVLDRQKRMPIVEIAKRLEDILREKVQEEFAVEDAVKTTQKTNTSRSQYTVSAEDPLTAHSSSSLGTSKFPAPVVRGEQKAVRKKESGTGRKKKLTLGQKKFKK